MVKTRQNNKENNNKDKRDRERNFPNLEISNSINIWGGEKKKIRERQTYVLDTCQCLL